MKEEATSFDIWRHVFMMVGFDLILIDIYIFALYMWKRFKSKTMYIWNLNVSDNIQDKKIGLSEQLLY